MPVLPVYDSKQNIQSNTQAPLRNNDPLLQGAEKPFQEDQKVLETVGNITQKWSDANDVMQYTKAKSDASLAISQQESLAKMDPNLDNADAHIKAIQDAATKSVDGISNQMVAQKASQEIKADAFISSIKVNSMFKQKKMLANDINLQSAADLAAKNKSDALTPAQGQQVEHDFMRTVSENFNSGLINEGRAKSLIDDFRMGEVKNDIIKEGATQIGDSQVLSEINKGKDGKYSALSTDQRTEASRMVRLQIRDNKEISTETNMSTRVDTIKAIANGDLTWQNTAFINNMASKDPGLAEAMQKVFQENKKGGSYTASEDKNSDFETLVGNVFKANTKEDINKYLLKSLTAGMSMDRLSIIVNAAEQRGANLPTMEGSKNGQVDPKQEAIDNSVKHIQNYIKTTKSDDGNVMVNFFKNIMGGASPSVAKDAAIKTSVESRISGYTTQPGAPNVVVSKDSPTKYIFTGNADIHPGRIWNEKLGKFEINVNREKGTKDAGSSK